MIMLYICKYAASKGGQQHLCCILRHVHVVESKQCYIYTLPLGPPTNSLGTWSPLFSFPPLVISTLLSITLQGLLLLCNVFACHKFYTFCQTKYWSIHRFALLFSVSLIPVLLYCGTKNVKAVKGCSVFTNHFLV